MAGPLSGEKNEWSWKWFGPLLIFLRVFWRVVDLWTGYSHHHPLPVSLSSSHQENKSHRVLGLGVVGSWALSYSLSDEAWFPSTVLLGFSHCEEGRMSGCRYG